MAGKPRTPEAFSRVVIDALLKDAGWDLTDGCSVRYEVQLPDGTKADYVLCDRYGRSLAVIEAKRAAENAHEAAVRSIQLQQAAATAKAQATFDALLAQTFNT